MLFPWRTKAKNQVRIVAIRDGSPTAVEAFARMFTDVHIIDG
jgi:hypothetical protein